MNCTARSCENSVILDLRVVDHLNPDSVSSAKELSTLYWCMQETESEHFLESRQYEDVVLQKTMERFSRQLTKYPFEHNDHLLHKEQNKLSITEKQLAMDEYEKSLYPGVTWITEEKWKKQGIMAEVVRFPQDHTVFTTSGSAIHMTQGQRMMKLKINDKHYIQLENGEIHPVII